MKIAEVSGLKKTGSSWAWATRGPNPENKIVIPFSAQFCEVAVDTLTGEIEILRFLSANESGRVMHRKGYDSQVIGGMAMGIGLATTEMRVLDDGQTGKLCNRNWHDYKLPTSLDVPADIVSVPIEMPDDEANTDRGQGSGRTGHHAHRRRRGQRHLQRRRDSSDRIAGQSLSPGRAAGRPRFRKGGIVHAARIRLYPTRNRG
jgi:CO/xanthine dehydrogenase Mo-binding subunit